MTEITSSIFNNLYFQNITQISLTNANTFSQLPIYLCSLPSTEIDLSNQSFVILDRNTFPCFLNTTLRTINLSSNQISTVNLTFSTWLLINLSSNNLTQLPYTLLNSNTSINSLRQSITQRTLLLQFNRLTQFDLFAYTYSNTYLNLRNNPFSRINTGYHILNNVQRQSLRSGTMSNVSLPNDMRFLLDDQIAQNYGTCDSQSLRYLFEIFQRMKIDGVTIEIQCDCSTIYVKIYWYLLNTTAERITTRFPCSNTSSLTSQQFESLIESTCLANLTVSTNKLCQFARIEVIETTKTKTGSLSIIKLFDCF